MKDRNRISSSGALWLNSVQVIYPDRAIVAAVVPFTVETFHAALDDPDGKLHPVRLPGDQVALVPMVDDAVLPGPEVLFNARKNTRLLAALVRETIFRQLRGIADEKRTYRLLNRRSPVVETQRDFGLVPIALGLPSWLSKRVVMEFDTRTMNLPGVGETVVVTCSQRLRTIIGATCAELIELGVGLIGSYVCCWSEQADPRLDKRLALAGRVVRVEEGTLVLAEHGGGPNRVVASEAFLEPTRSNFNSVIEELTQRRAEHIISKLDAEEAGWRWGGAVRKRSENALSYFRNERLFLARGLSLELGNLVGDETPFPATYQFEKPIFSFDPGGRHSNTWAQGTLDRIGPYDRQTFEHKRLRVAVVCEASQRGRTSETVGAFLDGMPDVRSPKGLAPHRSGLVGRFRLQNAFVEYFEVPVATGEAYAEAARQALRASADREQPWDFAIIQVRREWKDRPEADSPYWMAKATFLKRDVPTQAFATNMMELPPFEQACALANAALATYAKLGGRPWLLRASRSTDHELVFGLGSHTRKTERRGAGERVVGITTVFSSEGNYLLDARTSAVSFEEYPEQLVVVLREAIGRIRQEEAWRPGDAVRLVFHAFIQIRRETVDAVLSAIRALGLERVSFAFLHVVEDHPWTLLDLSEEAAKAKKAAFGPDWGQAVELTNHEWLVSLTGRQQVRVDGQGVPAPILLRLHEDSTFRDMLYLSRQVSDFACHSWRTFGPSRVPISLLYADEIAKQLAGLELTPSWDPDAAIGRIMRRPWFL